MVAPTIPRDSLLDDRPVLQVSQVSKAFGQTQALRSCSLTLHRGEVHAIMGENGSGKSTLVKLLTGIHVPDGGTISPATNTHKAALAAGVVAVFQEILVAGPRSVLENIWLGSDGLLRDRHSPAEKVRRATEVLGRLLRTPPPLDLPVERLPISDRQACCIARAIVRDPSVLILDEATSALDVETRQRLFGLLRELAAGGTSIVFISHRMDEVEEISDKITVLRSGESVGTVERGASSAPELVRMMTGAGHLVPNETQVQVTAAAGAFSARAGTRGGKVTAEVVLRAREVRLSPGARPFDFSLAAGEIVGVAGLEGHGQDAFLNLLRGAGGDAAGSVQRSGVNISSPRKAARNGIVYVPRERRAEGLFDVLSIRDNFALPTVRMDGRAGLVSLSRTEERFRSYLNRLNIKIGNSDDPITTLSGGNQQKIVVARWLAVGPRVLVLNDPTRGVDLNAKRDLYSLLADLSAEGVAVVMLSTELDELVELMHRVLVFREQELFRELPSAEVTRETLVASFFGQDERPAQERVHA